MRLAENLGPTGGDPGSGSRGSQWRGDGPDAPAGTETRAARQARTVGQEPDLVSVETQVWHVTVAVPFHQVLKSQRKVPVGTSPDTGCLQGSLALERSWPGQGASAPGPANL